MRLLDGRSLQIADVMAVADGALLVGVDPEARARMQIVVESLLAMLNAGVWPVVPEQGSVGASGASWVSFHHGGCVGIGILLHAGQVIVADGSECMRCRLECILTNDPGIGVARHVDAGYDLAIANAAREGIRIPMQES